jgi:hypothetical protein
MKDKQLNEIENELTFWEDYISVWEKKNGRIAEGRMLEALAAARKKYHQFIVLH